MIKKEKEAIMPEKKILQFRKRMGGEVFLAGIDSLVLKSQIEIFRILLEVCFSEEEVREVLKKLLKWTFREFNTTGKETKEDFRKIFLEIEALCFDFKVGFFAPFELVSHSKGTCSRIFINANL